MMGCCLCGLDDIPLDHECKFQDLKSESFKKGERILTLENQLSEALAKEPVEPDYYCGCGHLQSEHIYHDGACRPGYACVCKQYKKA